MSNAVCQKYQDVLLPVRFCSIQTSMLFWLFLPTILCATEVRHGMLRDYAINKAESTNIWRLIDRWYYVWQPEAVMMTDNSAFKSKHYTNVMRLSCTMNKWFYTVAARSSVDNRWQMSTFFDKCQLKCHHTLNAAVTPFYCTVALISTVSPLKQRQVGAKTKKSCKTR